MTAIPTARSGSTRHTVARTPRTADYRHADAVADELAQRLYVTPAGAHQILVGALNLRVAEVIHAHIAAAAHDRLSRWLQPIWDAEAHVTAPALSSDLIAEAERTENADETARIHYLTHPSAETARALARANGRAMAKLRLEQLALAGRFGFTL